MASVTMGEPGEGIKNADSSHVGEGNAQTLGGKEANGAEIASGPNTGAPKDVNAEVGPGDGNKKRKRNNRRNKRDKKLSMTCALHMISFARSKMANALHTPVGYYLLAAGAPKGVISFMNRVGLSVSYRTIVDGMKVMGAASMAAIKKQINEVNVCCMFFCGWVS